MGFTEVCFAQTSSFSHRQCRGPVGAPHPCSRVTVQAHIISQAGRNARRRLSRSACSVNGKQLKVNCLL